MARCQLSCLGEHPTRGIDADHPTISTNGLAEELAQLLANLVAARTKDVPLVLRRQRIALLVVAGLFAITAVYSTLLLV
jgi:hypothetical protein